MNTAGLALTSELDRDQVLQRVADQARAVANAKYAALGVFNVNIDTGQPKFSDAPANTQSNWPNYNRAILVTVAAEEFRLDLHDAVEVEGIAPEHLRQGNPAALGLVQLGVRIDAADARLHLAERVGFDQIGLVEQDDVGAGDPGPVAAVVGASAG